MSKRAATTELNHENWDKEDDPEPEEPGVFQKANSEVLEKRIIRTAKRRVKPSNGNSDAKPSPFSGFTGFSSSSTTSLTSPFSFLSQNKSKSDVSEKNGGKQDCNESLGKEAQPQFKSFVNSSSSENQPKSTFNFSPSSNQKSTITNTETTFKPFEHIFKQKSANETNEKAKNLELLKDLNLSCSSWISEHLDKNPYCILTPIFKDYEKHLAQLELNPKSEEKEENTETEKSNNGNTLTETAKTFNLNKESNESLIEQEKEKEKETEASKEFKVEGIQPVKPFPFPFSSTTSPFGGPSPFSLNQIAAKPVSEADNESKKDDEESEEPPKNDFVPVIEEDSIFDMKCKVFVKKEGNFVSRGVGTLFLKPVKDSTKTQLVVRAHTNLGNILLNVLLTTGMPIQKTGKNNAMIVCIPTPESQPPPVPVLIRVKTSEECDTLIKKLEECRGS